MKASDIKTVQDARDLLRKGHGQHTDDSLQYLWDKYRNDGAMAKRYGQEYVGSTPGDINDDNLKLTFEELTTDKLIEIRGGNPGPREAPRDKNAPFVLIKFNSDYHFIDGNRRLWYWFSKDVNGPHKVCVLVIKRRR